MKRTAIGVVALALLLLQRGGTQVSGGIADLRRAQTIAFSSVSVAASGDNTIVSADATRKIKVLCYVLIADGTVAVTWKSGASTAKSGAMALVVNSGAVAPCGSPGSAWWLETAVNEALVLNLSAAIGVRGHLTYFLEP